MVLGMYENILWAIESHKSKTKNQWMETAAKIVQQEIRELCSTELAGFMLVFLQEVAQAIAEVDKYIWFCCPLLKYYFSTGVSKPWSGGQMWPV